MSDSTQLSEHFALGELTRTDMRQYLAPNYAAAANDPRVLSAIRALCVDILEPIRAKFNAPMIVHSGFRMPALNAAVHGQPGSQHQLGEAADFHIVGVDLRMIFDWIRLESGLPFGQVILEGRPASWVHVSLGAPFRLANRCGQALIATPGPDGEMRYVGV